MSLPSKLAIAQWWCSTEAREDLARHDRLWIDIEEPACQACGYYSEYWDDVKPGKRWAKSSLQRAHIHAASDGGSEAPANFLLLCRDCHEAAPMTADRSEMLTWACRRETDVALRCRTLQNELSALGMDALTIPTSEQIARAFEKLSPGVHWGVGMSAATIAVVVKCALSGT